MDNQTNTSEPVVQTPVNQEPVVPQPPIPASSEPTESVNQTPLNQEPIVPETPVIEAELPPQPEPPLQPQSEVFTPPPIINTPPRSSDQQLQDLGISPPQKTNNVFKTIFIIALIIFLLVASVFAYVYFKDQANSKIDTSNSSSFDTVKTNPTSTPTSNVTCFLNDEIYQVGESFFAADGCNTCSCNESKQIVCTEKVCAPTPTKVATISATITPTKIATPTATK